MDRSCIVGVRKKDIDIPSITRKKINRGRGPGKAIDDQCWLEVDCRKAADL